MYKDFILLFLLQFVSKFPLSFVRSGFVDLNNGSLRRFALNGYGWSSISVAFTSVTSATAYHLVFNASGVYPSYGPYDRRNGFPIRCPNF